jgi:hypothetical protein
MTYSARRAVQAVRVQSAEGLARAGPSAFLPFLVRIRN